MPYHRGDIPWNDIKDRFIKGESASAIARDYPISRQAIQKRAKKEGWSPDGWLEQAHRTPTAKAVAKPETRSQKTIAALGKRTPENAAEICRLIERGVPHTVAAEAVGMHRDTLKAWRDDDPVFGAMVDAARHRSIACKIERIDEAGARGDWKADSWYLERAPETRQGIWRNEREWIHRYYRQSQRAGSEADYHACDRGDAGIGTIASEFGQARPVKAGPSRQGGCPLLR